MEELPEETGMQPGTAYPILLRLEHEGWVTSRWENIDPAGGETPGPPVLPPDGRRRGPGQRRPFA